MSLVIKAKVAKYLEDALGKPVIINQYPADTPLNEVGLDSLATIGVLVSMLEDSGVDMGEYADSLVTPSTLGDLFEIAKRFMADDKPAPDANETPRERRSQLEYYQEKLAYEIDSADMLAALAAGQDLVVIDGRSSEAYELEHIPGAVNIPHRSISQERLSGLSKAPLYVAYCDGIGCNASTKTAFKLATAGFRVKELIGGLDWWKLDGQATEGVAGSVQVKQVDCECAG